MDQNGPKGAKRQRLRPKHVPQRTCVGCREIRAKREMVRIVRTLDGRVEVDPTGKKAGRGAYLCKARPCWEAGLRKKRLEWALHTTIAEGDMALLAEYARGLAEEAPRQALT